MNELEPVKQVLIVEQFPDVEWLVPTTKDHTIKIEKRTHGDWAYMKRWCEQNSEDTVVIWPDNGHTEVYFYFFRITDALAFKLRWT